MPPGGSEIDRAAIAEDGNHLSQDLLVAEWGILPQMRVAASDEAIALSADHPVREKSPIAMAQNNPSGEQFGRASTANGQHVSGPDGGQHTGSGDLQPHLPKLPKHLRGQVVFGLVEKLSGRLHWIISRHQETTCSRACHFPQPGYEVLRLLRHCDCVDCILAHRSALVSKTLS